MTEREAFEKTMEMFGLEKSSSCFVDKGLSKLELVFYSEDYENGYLDTAPSNFEYNTDDGTLAGAIFTESGKLLEGFFNTSHTCSGTQRRLEAMYDKANTPIEIQLPPKTSETVIKYLEEKYPFDLHPSCPDFKYVDRREWEKKIAMNNKNEKRNKRMKELIDNHIANFDAGPYGKGRHAQSSSFFSVEQYMTKEEKWHLNRLKHTLVAEARGDVKRAEALSRLTYPASFTHC